MIIKLLKEKNMKPYELANILDVSVPQIYNWDKNGILENSKYYDKIKEILPELEPKPPTLTKKGKPDNRTNSGKKAKDLTLKESDIEAPTEKIRTDSIFPTIIFRKKK